VQDYYWPLAALVFSDDPSYNGTHLLEKIILQSGLSASWVGRMGDDNAALTGGWVDVPGEVLFDGNRKTGVESTLDAIIPMSLVWITVMRIQHGLVVIQKI
jgi:hypothetical protein